jgi:hypothetical protein
MRLVALLTIGVIAALAPLAYADPPDPSWINGIWDDDDYDAVVIMVLGTSATVDVALINCNPLWSPLATVLLLEARATAAAVDGTASPRAPPQSRAA